MDTYDLVLFLGGLALLGTAVVPLLLANRPLSFPIVYVAIGIAVFAVPGMPDFHPLDQPELAERLSELAIIVALMGAGLKLDRPVGWASWTLTWRLLAVAMPLTIVATGLLGWWAGLAPAAAMLFGAAVAPTDPVLASDVQVGPPGEGEEDEARFALTSEAGLNDGLAFPFTNAAIAAVGAAGVSEWVGGWLLDDVLAKIGIALVVGLVAGRLLAWLMFHLPGEQSLAESAEGIVALAATLTVYGLTQLAHGYGFLAVFVAASVLRHAERDHEYHQVLHATADSVERLVSSVLLIFLGGAVADGVLGPIGWRGVALGLAVLLVVRPVSGLLSLVGTGLPPGERGVIAAFGIRGIGSIYYLAHGLNEARFADAERLWGLVAFIIVASVLMHGVSASPVMQHLDRRRSKD